MVDHAPGVGLIAVLVLNSQRLFRVAEARQKPAVRRSSLP